MKWGCSADKPVAIPIEYPIAYHGAPEAYKTILDDLFLLQASKCQDESIFAEVSDTIGFFEYPNPIDSALGYALADLNNDGILELMLGTIDGINNATPNSVFTLKDNQPIQLEVFWSRSRGVISTDGIIYGVASGGAQYTSLSSYRLDKNADTLTQLTDIRSDYSNSEGKPYFIEVIEGKDHYISEQEFYELCKIYGNPPERIKLAFIPIGS